MILFLTSWVLTPSEVRHSFGDIHRGMDFCTIRYASVALRFTFSYFILVNLISQNDRRTSLKKFPIVQENTSCSWFDFDSLANFQSIVAVVVAAVFLELEMVPINIYLYNVHPGLGLFAKQCLLPTLCLSWSLSTMTTYNIWFLLSPLYRYSTISSPYSFVV